MRIARNWLNDYVDILDLTPEAFSEIITTKVAEVDAIEHLCVPLEKAILAEITKIVAHPERTNLSLVTVFMGGDSVTIVSGAPNLALGQLVAFVPPGGQVYAAGSLVTVERREVAGIGSPGVLASESELGLTADHSGVMTFGDSGLRAGMPLSSVTEGPDYVLLIDNKSLTHRPDLWCHYGFARELSAILGRELKQNPDRFSDDSSEGAATIAALGSGRGKFETAVEDGCGCRRFMGVEIEGVSITRSPLWIRRRLHSAEVGAKNTIVDLSNYVMLDIGQPNHTYDADKLKGRVIRARRAAAGERFLGLDDIERVLDEQDMVIADGSGAVALAGIIGGALSAISEGTRRLFLESANFDPTLVRWSSKRHQTRTDASNRFEKSPSAFAAALGLARFVEILTKIDKGARLKGGVVDAFPQRPSRLVIPTTFSHIRKRVGADLENSVTSNILSSLGFKISETKRGEVIEVVVPYWRASKDVSEPQDLVEEVGRIYGYERVPETVPLVSASVPERDSLRDFEYSVRDMLAAAGFSESYGYSTISGSYMDRLGYDLESSFRLENPVDTAEAHLRLSLVPGLLGTLSRNSKRFPELAFFELGRTYRKNKLVPGAGKQGDFPSLEDRRVVLGFSSGASETEVSSALSPALKLGGSFYVLASLIRSLNRAISPALVEFVPFEEVEPRVLSGIQFVRSDLGKLLPWMHPFRSAAVVINRRIVGSIAEVFPGVVPDLPERAVCAELSLPALLESSSGVEVFSPIPKYPDSLFELSIVAKHEERYAKLERLLKRAVPSELLRRLEVVSLYVGSPLQEGEKSISVRFYFGAPDRTLSSAEIKELELRVMQAVEQGPYGIRR